MTKVRARSDQTGTRAKRQRDTLGKGGGNTERRIARKLAKANENSVSGAGRSIIEMLEEELDKAMREWLTYKGLGGVKEDTTEKMASVRGKIRGIAISVALMKQPYSWKRSLKSIEKESLARVRVE